MTFDPGLDISTAPHTSRRDFGLWAREVRVCLDNPVDTLTRHTQELCDLCDTYEVVCHASDHTVDV